MKKFLFLTAIPLILSASVPSLSRAQSSAPTDSSMPSAPAATPSPINSPSSTPSVPSAPAAVSSTCSMAAMSPSTNNFSSSTSSNMIASAKSADTRMLAADSTKTQAMGTLNNISAPLLIKASSDQVEYNNLIGPTHYIDLSVGSSPLCSLTVKPLQDVDANNSIKVLDESGKPIAANITEQEDGGAKISFERPVASGSMLTLALYGVEYSSTLTPAMVQYSLSGEFVGYSQEVPYGVAQIARFLR